MQHCSSDFSFPIQLDLSLCASQFWNFDEQMYWLEVELENAQCEWVHDSGLEIHVALLKEESLQEARLSMVVSECSKEDLSQHEDVLYPLLVQ